MRKTVLFKVRLFSCFVVDFILRSFLFTHIEIVILTTKKYFLHRDLLFFMNHKTYIFAATNESMNFITSLAQGQAASRNITTGHQNFLY